MKNELGDPNVAPLGFKWVCMACGKTSENREGGDTASPGWDESCMLNSRLYPLARLIYDETKPGRVRAVQAIGENADGAKIDEIRSEDG